MSQKLRRMVMKRAALCDRVLGAVNVQGPEIGNRLGELFSPVLADGEQSPDQQLTLQLHGRRLQGFRDAMVETDADYLKQLAIWRDLQLESERPTARLKSSILSLRSTCEGLFGKESLRSLGLDFNLAQNPQGVLRQGEIIRERILSFDGELTPERWVKATLTTKELASEIGKDIEEQQAIVRRLDEQRKLVDTAKVRKDQALQDFDRQFIHITRVLEATFRVVGESELADRIRPTVRQLGRDDGQEPEESKSEAQPPSESEASEQTSTPAS